jgi:hypothetical protein
MAAAGTPLAIANRLNRSPSPGIPGSVSAAENHETRTAGPVDCNRTLEPVRGIGEFIQAASARVRQNSAEWAMPSTRPNPCRDIVINAPLFPQPTSSAASSGEIGNS